LIVTFVCSAIVPLPMNVSGLHVPSSFQPISSR